MAVEHSPTDVISPEAVAGLVTHIAHEVNRNKLWDALLGTRLVDKDTTKVDVKRRFHDSHGWAKHVLRCLEEPSTRDDAFRVLNRLIEAYIQMPGVDSRIKTLVHKARTAAERQDVAQLQKALSKLEVDAAMIDAKLPTASLVVYLAATTSRARDVVASAIAASVPVEPLARPLVAPATTPPAAIRDSDPAEPAAPPSTPAQLAHAMEPRREGGGSPIEDLRDTLRRLTDRSSVATRPWDVAVLRANVEAHLPEVDWPSIAGFALDLKTQLRQLRVMVTDLEAATVDETTLIDVRQGLRELQPIVERVVGLVAAADTAALALQVRGRAVAGELDDEDRPEAEAACAQLGLASHAQAVGDLIRLVRRTRTRRLERLAELVVEVEPIALAASALDAAEAESIRTEVEAILARRDADGLARLRQAVDARVAIVSMQHQNVAAVATSTLHVLEHLPDVLPEAAERCLAAVRAGDAREAIAGLIGGNARWATATATTSPESGHRLPPPQVLPLPAADAAALPQIASADLERFEPRNAITASYLRQRSKARPAETLLRLLEDEEEPSVAVQLAWELVNAWSTTARAALAVFRLLELRAIEELARGSALGAIEHGFDIVELAARAAESGQTWWRRGAALLAIVPPVPSTTGQWGRRAADAAREILAAPDPLPLALERLFGAVAFSQAIAERYTHSAFRHFVEPFAATLHAVAVQDEERAHLRDDLALGVATGTRYGSDEVVRKLLLELASAAGVDDSDRTKLRALLGQGSTSDRRGIKQLDRRVLTRLPDWLQTAAEAYLAMRGAMNESVARPGDRLKPFTLIVPRSVNEAGGFVFVEGDRSFQVVPMVSTAVPGLFNVELFLRASDNRDWLGRDVVAHIGALVADQGEQQRQLLQLDLPLARALRVEDRALTLTCSLRWIDSENAKSPAPQSRSLTIPLTRSRQLALQDYPGAAGTPILLVEQNLELSSSSVRAALSEILDQFRAGRPAAFLITGRRRRGKTSILETVMSDREVQRHFVVVFDSLEDVPFRNLQQALAHLGKILDVAAARLGVAMTSLADQLRYTGGWAEIQDWLRQLETLLARPTRLLLLVDEFQKWMSALDSESRTKILASLRGLMNRSEQSRLSFSMVLSGLSNLKRYVASSADFRNAVKWKVIGAFSNLEAERLIRSNGSIDFDTRAVTALRDFSGGNPFLINLLGNKVVEWLRRQQHSYCFREDVDQAVRDELGTEESRGWSFLQYLLKEGEEDHAPEIEELPSLVAVAWSLQQRGSLRTSVRLHEVLADLAAAGVDHDPDTVKADLAVCVEDELLLQEGERYSFASQCVREWLAARHDSRPLPIRRELREGLVLNRYKIVRNLPRGGQASSVFTAVDTHLHDQTVVLKIYARDQGGGASTLVEREARALTKVEHGGVIRVQGYGEDKVYGHVLVLEHASGDDLRRLLHDPPPTMTSLAGPLGDLKAQVGLLVGVTHALAECHRAGVVHKDIKPEHILVRRESGVLAPKIIDFGLAVEVAPAMGGKIATEAAFSGPYVAPEKLRGLPREAPADIYSLGVVAFELFTGRLPFDLDGMLPVRGRPIELRAIRPEAPQRLSGLIERMMADDPKDRPSAVSVASELEVVLEPEEWTDFWEAGKNAYNAGDRHTALRGFQQAAFAAPFGSRKSVEYLEVLEHLVMLLDEEPGVLRACEQMMQPLVGCCLAATDSEHRRRQTLLRDYCQVILQAPRAVGDGTTASMLLHDLCGHLLTVEPVGVAATLVEMLLSAAANPVVWEQRETIHELGLRYRSSLLKTGALEAWCIGASRRLREHNAALVDCQRWLRRAERLGVDGNRDYREEREKLERALSKTAHGARLPAAVTEQEDVDKTIGDDERGHLHVDRIAAWVKRLYGRHPYIQSVRRVQKDGAIAPRPNRILEVTQIARHAKVAVGIAQERIIPAVLDQSFCAESCALRVNILLAEGVTIAQREAVMAELRKDTELFPADG
jgi:hypothetical protein